MLINSINIIFAELDKFGKNEDVEIAKMTKEEREMLTLRQLHEMDDRAILKGAEMIGYDKGRQQERLEISRALLCNGVSADIVAASTGLTKEQVEAL